MTEIEKYYIEHSKSNLDVDSMFSFWEAREQARAEMSYGVLTEDVINKLTLYAPILEIGSGTGYWAFEFLKRGVPFVATDINPCSGFFERTEPYTDIEKLSAIEAITKYPNHNLLTCWPSYAEPWAYEGLKAFTGQYVFYVGEGQGGCTADGDFHDLLESNFEIEIFDIPQWYGLHDCLFIGRRK
jgi:hypothetical protein